MREQGMPQKVVHGSGVGGKHSASGIVQRPVRRARGPARKSFDTRLRTSLRYLPLVVKLVLAIGAGVLVFATYRSAASASFFKIREVEVQGASRSSVEKVQALVKREVGSRGVWEADLKKISEDLARLPWIRGAIVSRVLPDGIRVRLTEREPRAIVRTSSGRFLWVDDDAVLLGEMLPTDQLPAFFLRGWNEEESETARSENSERVRKFLELQREWVAAGLSERVSEVNLMDVRDVRAQLAGDDSQIEVRLGSQDLGKRLKDALNVLDEQRQTPRGPFVSYVDLSQGKRAVVGFLSGAHAISNSGELSAGLSASETARSSASSSKADGNKRTSGPAATRAESNKKRERKADRKEQTKEKPRRNH